MKKILISTLPQQTSPKDCSALAVDKDEEVVLVPLDDIDSACKSLKVHLSGHQEGTFEDIETFFKDAEDVVTDVQLKRKDDGSLGVNVCKTTVAGGLKSHLPAKSLTIPEANLNQSGLMSKKAAQDLNQAQYDIEGLQRRVNSIPVYPVDIIWTDIPANARKDNGYSLTAAEMADEGWKIVFNPGRAEDGEARFVAFLEDGADSVYTDNFEGAENYNFNGIFRDDMLFSHNGCLYHGDGNDSLVRLVDETEIRDAVSAAVEAAEELALERRWAAAFGNGKYGRKNHDTGFYEANGLTDITSAQARVILEYGRYPDFRTICANPYYGGTSAASGNPEIRTTIPTILEDGVEFPQIMWPPQTETIQFTMARDGSVPYMDLTHDLPTYVTKLKHIYDVLRPTKAVTIGPTDRQINLRTVRIYQLNYNISFPQCSSLSRESLIYLAEHTLNPAKQLSATVHPSIYEKLTAYEQPLNLILRGNATQAWDGSTTSRKVWNWDKEPVNKSRLRVTICYELGEEDTRLLVSLTGGWGASAHEFTTKGGVVTESATIVYDTYYLDGNKEHDVKVYRYSGTEKGHDPGTKVHWIAVTAETEEPQYPVPALSELDTDEEETEQAQWAYVRQTAASRGISFATKE